MDDGAAFAPKEWEEFCQAFVNKTAPNFTISDLENGNYCFASNHPFIIHDCMNTESVKEKLYCACSH